MKAKLRPGSDLSARLAPAAVSFWLVSGLLSGLPAAAGTLLPFDQGAITGSSVGGPPPCNPGNFLNHNPGAMVMIIGASTIPGGCFSSSSTNSYALFNLPADLGAVQSAVVSFELTVQLGAGDNFGWQAHDVSSPAAAFQTAYGGLATPAGLALLADLGDGELYGSGFAVSGGTFSLQFALPAAGLVNLAAAQGGGFGIGFTGHNASPFMGVSGTLSNLRLEVALVPEPSKSMLMVTGLLAVGCLAARQARGGRPSGLC
jgi:hypothetical protein